MSKLDRMLEGMKDYELDKNGGDKKMDDLNTKQHRIHRTEYHYPTQRSIL